jgi:hypothetical protein
MQGKHQENFRPPKAKGAILQMGDPQTVVDQKTLEQGRVTT